MSKIRYRLQYKFWLNQQDELDAYMVELINWLKKDRTFTRAVREGLRLWSDLRGGGTEVLLELFPDIRQRLAVQPQASTPPDSGDLQRQISAAVAAGVQQAMMELPAPPAGYPMMKSPIAAQPKVETKVAQVPDAGAIADNFLAFIQ